MALRQKTLSGLMWSFLDSMAGQGISFITGVILARILTPHDFGLIGMLTIFIAISQSFIDSGFSQALIRKQNCSSKDYSTVFYFNFLVAILFYFLLYFLSNPISGFFKEPQLELIIKVLGLGLVFNSLAIIQRTILIKELNFKSQARISIVTSIVSGVFAVFMAYKGYGVWSLVVLTLSRFAISTFLLWIWSQWKPMRVFSKTSFKELFSFGSKLLVSGLIDTTYRNIYYLIIGKFFSTIELGYYTRADQFKTISSQNLQGIISRVSFPVLSSMQDDIPKLKMAYKRLIKSTMLISFMLMLGIAAVAKPMIITLIGEKWIPSIVYLQLLCFVGMLYPLHALNLNMLQIQGRSDLFLRLEIIKKIIAVPVVLIGIVFSVKAMIIGMIINSFIAYFLNSYWSGKLIDYSFNEQLKDIFPSFILAVIINGLVLLIGLFISLPSTILLILQVIFAILMVIIICELLKFSDYFYLKTIVLERIKKSSKNG